MAQTAASYTAQGGSIPPPATQYLQFIPACLPGLFEAFNGDYVPRANIAVRRALDIGANCGAFSILARMRWPGSEIFCYEPHPENFAALANNCEITRAIPFRLAIGRPGKRTLYHGDGTNLCASLHHGPRTIEGGVEVDVMSPADLPLADLAKIDTEGAEVEIIESWPQACLPTYLMIEYHSESARRAVDGLLRQTHGLCYARAAGPGLGVAHYHDGRVA